MPDRPCPDARPVRTFIQSTEAVAPEEAFAYWRDTAMPLTGSIIEAGPRCAFTASRLVAIAEGATLLHTRSDPIGVARTPEAVRRDPRDGIVLAVFLQGGGYVEQNGGDARLGPGDVSLVDAARPYRVGGDQPYEEVRLVVARDVFRARVGEPGLLAGRRLGGGPLGGLFADTLRSYAGAVAGMDQTAARIGLEAVLHLLRGLVDAPGSEVTGPGLRVLAEQCIARALHDPDFGPEALWRGLGVSRSRLYAAFADGPGVAAVIRDARLDRAHARLCAPRHARESISATQLACGFADASVFATTFRRRFGLSPRDLRARVGHGQREGGGIRRGPAA